MPLQLVSPIRWHPLPKDPDGIVPPRHSGEGSSIGACRVHLPCGRLPRPGDVWKAPRPRGGVIGGHGFPASFFRVVKFPAAYESYADMEFLGGRVLR